VDKFFDSCNAVNFNDLKFNRRPITRNSFHFQYRDKSIQWLKGIEFVGSKARIYYVDVWQLSLVRFANAVDRYSVTGQISATLAG
jgi:hypothetical protein